MTLSIFKVQYFNTIQYPPAFTLLFPINRGVKCNDEIVAYFVKFKLGVMCHRACADLALAVSPSHSAFAARITEEEHTADAPALIKKELNFADVETDVGEPDEEMAEGAAAAAPTAPAVKVELEPEPEQQPESSKPTGGTADPKYMDITADEPNDNEKNNKEVIEAVVKEEDTFSVPRRSERAKLPREFVDMTDLPDVNFSSES